MARKKPTKRASRKKLSPDERKRNKIKNAHMRSVRSTLRNLGFDRVIELTESEVTFGGQAGELDDVFIYENLLLFVEYTTSQSSDVTSHLKNKKIIFSRNPNRPKGFLDYIRDKYAAFHDRLGARLHVHNYVIRVVYCSRHPYDTTIHAIVDEPVYLDYPILKYFERLAGIIKMSALDEMLEFLRVNPAQVAKKGVFPSKSQSDSYDGSILPKRPPDFL